MIKNAIWLFTFTFFIFILFLPSFSKMQDMRNKNIEYKAEIAALKQKNAQLANEKRRLETDPVYLEMIAREKMGLIREGEVIYKVMPEGKKQ